MFSVGQLRLKDWVLVLYGTDRNPQQPITSTTTTTTTVPTTTINKRIRKHEIDSPYYASVNTQQHITHEQTKKKYHKETRNNRKQKNPKRKKKPKFKDTSSNRDQNNYYSPLRDTKIEQHKCIFETLAKQNNMSTKQYFQLMRKKDLSSGKTMSCDLIM